jgi:hypothetical protein
MLAVPAAVESIWKPEGPYLSIRRANNSHPKEVGPISNTIVIAQPPSFSRTGGSDPH